MRKVMIRNGLIPFGHKLNKLSHIMSGAINLLSILIIKKDLSGEINQLTD
jgi:hypothetical protein